MTGVATISVFADVFEYVSGDLPQDYVAEMEILTKDQKTFPTCFVALLNP